MLEIAIQSLLHAITCVTNLLHKMVNINVMECERRITSCGIKSDKKLDTK